MNVHAVKVLDILKSYSTPPYKDIFISLYDVIKFPIEKKLLDKFKNDGFFAGILIYLHSKKYTAVVTYGHRSMFTLSMCRYVFGDNNVRHIAKEIFFESAKQNTLRKKLVWIFIKKFLTKVDLFIVNSSAEVEEYAKLFQQPVNKFIFVYWLSNIETILEKYDADGTILAVGKSLRDWKTFFAAVHDVHNVIVVASKKDLINLSIPQNVKLHCDISRDEYLSLLKKCSVVVIPLCETIRSTGQTAFLEAMAFGKPVIVAKVNGSIDYIEDYVNGVFYRAHDASDLNSKIKLLISNYDLCDKIAENAKISVKTKYNRFEYSKAMYDLVVRLCS